MASVASLSGSADVEERKTPYQTQKDATAELAVEYLPVSWVESMLWCWRALWAELGGARRQSGDCRSVGRSGAVEV